MFRVMILTLQQKKKTYILSRNIIHVISGALFIFCGSGLFFSPEKLLNVFHGAVERWKKVLEKPSPTCCPPNLLDSVPISKAVSVTILHIHSTNLENTRLEENACETLSLHKNMVWYLAHRTKGKAWYWQWHSFSCLTIKMVVFVSRSRKCVPTFLTVK